MEKSASAHVVAPGFGFDPGPPCTRSVHVKEIHQMPDLEILLLKGSILQRGFFGSGAGDVVATRRNTAQATGTVLKKSSIFKKNPFPGP